MTIYTLIEDTIIPVTIECDIANLEAFERELDDTYPEGWAYNRDELIEMLPDDNDSYPESDPTSTYWDGE